MTTYDLNLPAGGSAIYTWIHIGLQFVAKKQKVTTMSKSLSSKVVPLLALSVLTLSSYCIAADSVAAGRAAATSASQPMLATPYPDNEKDFPGKGPARKFPYMQGERDAFFKAREKDQGAIVFVGDSLTGGWKNLARDFPDRKVANRGVGGDTSRNVLFRFKEDVMVLKPKAIVIEIGNNDLTAMGKPADTLSNVADMLAIIRKEMPDVPVVICSIPSSANPKAPVKAADRKTINEGLKKLVSEQKNTAFCDLYTPLANEDGSPKAEHFVADKLHLSDEGHSKWAEMLKPIFEQMKVK